MPQSLAAHAGDVVDYLNTHVLAEEALSTADLLDALASLGITLVEDPVADSAQTYYEQFRDGEPGDGAISGP